jgi:RNA polymerase sigma-70 factor (ECF subfamily)
MTALNDDPQFSGQHSERALTSAPLGSNRRLGAAAALKLVESPREQGKMPVAQTTMSDAEHDAADALRSTEVLTAQRAARDASLSSLLARAAKSDQLAFAGFYDATVGYAQALARRMVGAADIEDVLADAYLQVWRKAGSFDAQRGSPVTWLLLLVRSRSLDLLRKPREEQLDEDLPDMAAEDAGPPDLLETTQGSAALHAALAQLGAKERWALSLAYYRDLSHAEIAAQTGMPLGTVKSLINRAQQKLRALLHEYKLET